MPKDVIHISEAEAASDFAALMARVRAGAEVINQLHKNLPELAIIEGNQLVATKPDESFSPSLFTLCSRFTTIRRH
jgi:hypothetical protein